MMTPILKTPLLMIPALLSLQACQLTVDSTNPGTDATATPVLPTTVPTTAPTTEPTMTGLWTLSVNEVEVCSQAQSDCANLPVDANAIVNLKVNGEFGIYDVSLPAQTLPSDVALEQTASIEFAEWYADLPAAYSIQFDDWCGHSSHGIYDYALPEFQKRNLVGSIGIIAGFCTDQEWAQAQEFIDSGWSIFNHTMTHVFAIAPSWQPDAVVTWDTEYQIGAANDLVAEKLNGYRMQSVAMPNDLLTTEVDNYVRNHEDFIAMRAPNEMDGTWVPSSGMNRRFTAKPCPQGSVCNGGLVPLDTFFLRNDLYGPYSGFGGFGTSSLIAMVDYPINYTGWALQYNHGVNDSSWESIPLDVFIEYADHLAKRRDAGDIWVATPETVTKYHQATIACTLKAPIALPHATLYQVDTESVACQRHLTAVTAIIDLLAPVTRVLQAGQPLEHSWTKATDHVPAQLMVNFNPAAGELLVLH